MEATTTPCPSNPSAQTRSASSIAKFHGATAIAEPVSLDQRNGNVQTNLQDLGSFSYFFNDSGFCLDRKTVNYPQTPHIFTAIAL